jgi:hypothetical protein
MLGGIPIDEGSQDITGSNVILLTEPGVPACCNISDMVTATITGSRAAGFELAVSLTSDGEVPLTFVGGAVSMDETGAVQDLTSAFTGAFDLNNSLPTIQATSDVEAVPEPSTWALMTLGFAGLGFAGWRSRRRSVSIAV